MLFKVHLVPELLRCATELEPKPALDATIPPLGVAAQAMNIRMVVRSDTIDIGALFHQGSLLGRRKAQHFWVVAN